MMDMPKVDPYNKYDGPRFVGLDSLRALTGKTLMSDVLVTLRRWPGDRDNVIGRIVPSHRAMRARESELRRNMQEANVPVADIEATVRNRLTVESAAGVFEWWPDFATERTMEGEAHTLVPGGGFGLNLELLSALRDLGCREIRINFNGIRERWSYLSYPLLWFEHGIRYVNPKPPYDEQIILAKSHMRRVDVYGQVPVDERDTVREKRDWMRQNRPWKSEAGT